MTQQRFTFDPPADRPDRPRPRPELPGPPRDRSPGRQGVAHDQASTLLTSAVYVRNPRARRYVVRVRADGVVRITIPNRGSKRQAILFAEQQQDWIRTELERAERERARPRELLPPETVQALQQQAKRDLPARLLALAAQFGLVVSRITIRSQRWRWGSCSRTGHVSLNWRLVTMPDWVRDYVLIHELMHLRRMDHSPAFWKLVADACPDYEVARTWLKKFKTVHPPA